MKKLNMSFTANKLAHQLNKQPSEFTKGDIIKFCLKNNIRGVNFRHIGGDGKLKTLDFAIQSTKHLDDILSRGERVDGSSLFASIDPGQSDLYVIPRYKTAFLNPFTSYPCLEIMCSYYTSKGLPFENAPENIVLKAHNDLKKTTGLTMQALGELEYYVIAPRNDLYPATSQKAYHEAAPYSKWEELRREVVFNLTQAGCAIKYAHSEVGHIRTEQTDMSQNEIEFLPANLEDAADQLVLAKWMLAMTGRKYDVAISMAPKISAGHAGSGMHIHTRFLKNGKPVMLEKGELSATAKKVIAGYLTMAESLTAFGNTVPTSYLRLVPHQEAPTTVCWGDRNRSVLVRVPLGWRNAVNMAKLSNPQDKNTKITSEDRQTVEYRSADGSADIHLFLAGLCVAAREGLKMKDALERAEKMYVGVNIFSDGNKSVYDKLARLPASCCESADMLLRDRAVYEKNGVFPARVIDGIAKKLKAYNDKGLSESLYQKDGEIKKLVDKYLYC